MLKQKTKDIEVNGKKYRLTRVDARTGSYIAAKLAILCAPAMKKGTIDEESLTKLLPALSRRDFDELQTILLKTVRQLVGADEMESPVLKGNDDFVDADLAYDVPAVINLTVQAAFFNVGDFFVEAGFLTPAGKA